jgi:hypothetical protein
MREKSHEQGRSQLLGFVRLMTSFKSKFPITEIGNAYITSARTHISATNPNEEVYYDAVIGIKYGPNVNASCYIESKSANAPSTIKKLPTHLEEFLVKAYRALNFWKDDKKKHKPLFLFVTNVPFDSYLLKSGSIVESELVKLLKRNKQHFDTKAIGFLTQNTIRDCSEKK